MKLKKESINHHSKATSMIMNISISSICLNIRHNLGIVKKTNGNIKCIEYMKGFI